MGQLHFKLAIHSALYLLLTGLISHAYVTWIAVRLQLQGTPAPPGSPWPMPEIYTSESTLKTIDPSNFEFTSNLGECDVINDAFTRYKTYLFSSGALADPDLPVLAGLSVTVENVTCGSDYYPYLYMNESYSLEISNDVVASLSASTIWGALRGIETFSQLVFIDYPPYQYRVNHTSIRDSPRFAHRGLLVDTARHYLPLDVILQIVDNLSWDKMNVLHWHVTDSQTFPFQSKTFPNMSELGAYQPWMIYTHEDVTNVVSYARLRGVRVIPEFDSPGHTYSWGYGLPDVLTPCWGKGLEGGPYVPNYPVHAEKETLNPSQEYTYDVVGQIWQEVYELFQDEFLHLGLDEAYYACWQSNPNISDWMVKMNFTEYSQVEAYYISRIIDIVDNFGAKYIIWQDPLDNNATVNLKSVIAVWKEDIWREYLQKYTSMGYEAILYSPWYINYVEYGQQWKEYYSVEPMNFTDDPVLQSRLVGGSAAAWAEYIDHTNIFPVLWPKVSAVAERLWSPQTVNDVDEAQYRLDQQRCRFLARGVGASPILPGYCLDYSNTRVSRP